MTDETITAILDVLTTVAPEIRAGLIGRRGRTTTENPTGDTQLAADVMADELLVDRLTALDGVGSVASEERSSPVDCGDGLAVAIDPLDGSSNLVSNNPMGTIVGVYDEPFPASGDSLVAGLSLVFGPITTLAVAYDGTVTEYELVDGDRTVAEANVQLPDSPTVYGFGGGDDAWVPAFRSFAEEIRHELKLRYGGALVADINQVLEYGGLFSYPALRDRPNGKLRYQFEVAPIAYLIETAGGSSTDGTASLLAHTPTTLHERSPIHVGNTSLINRLEAALD